MSEKIPYQPTPEEIKKAEEMMTPEMREMSEQKEKESQVLTAISPEGKEIRIEMAERISHWNDFYKKYDIRDKEGNLAVVKLGDLIFSQEKLDKIEQGMEKYGYNLGIIKPANVTVRELIEKLVEKDRLAGKFTSDKVDIDSDINKETLLNLTTGGKPSLLMCQDTESSPYHEDLSSLNADGIKAKFDREEVSGFDPAEYILFLRDYVDRNGIVPDLASWRWLMKTYEKAGQKPKEPLATQESSTCLLVDTSNDGIGFWAHESGESRSAARLANEYTP